MTKLIHRLSLASPLRTASAMHFMLICALLIAAPAAAAEPAATWTPCFNGTQTSGIAVDRVDGSVYAVVEGKGIHKSVDHGKTFTLVDGAIVKSHAETGCGLTIDPEGGRLMCFMCYGDAGGSLDGGKTWFKSSQGHWNWGAVDWSDPQAKTMVGDSHGDGSVNLSFDQGKTWTKASGASGIHLGVADANSILVGGDGGIFLSAKGSGWQKVSDLKPKGRTMKVFKGKCYWLDSKGVIASSDHGKTWAKLGVDVDGCVGPYFGVDEHSLMVVGLSGFSVTHDDGATWRVVAKLPDNLRTGWSAPEGGAPRDYWFVQFGWDPKMNIIYASSLHAPLVKCELVVDQEVLAQADQAIAQVERLKDPASPAYRAAALKLYLASSSLPLDAERTAKVAALTASVKEDIDARQNAVRGVLDAWDAAKFDKLLAEQRKPFAGTSLAGWFAEAALVGKAHVAAARFARGGSGAIPDAAKDAFAKQLDDAKGALTIDEFKQKIEAMKDEVWKLTSYKH